MSEVLPEFQYLQSATLNEAIDALRQDGKSRLCAGGSDLLVNMRRGLIELNTLIDISGIKEMKQIISDDAGFHIGAAVTLRKIAENETIGENYPAINEACISIAGPSHREVATLGGNLCLDTRCLYYNQSHWWRQANDFCLKYRGNICHVAPNKKLCRAAFSGDLAPALMVYGAEIEIAGINGSRRVALDSFYRDDGADHLKLAPTEIVVAIHLAPSQAISAYGKIRIRGAIDFPLAGIAIACEKTSSSNLQFTLAITGTNSCPILINVPGQYHQNDDLDEYLNRLAKNIQTAVTPLRTTTTPANYRRLSISAMAKKIAIRLARQLLDR